MDRGPRQRTSHIVWAPVLTFGRIIKLVPYRRLCAMPFGCVFQMKELRRTLSNRPEFDRDKNIFTWIFESIMKLHHLLLFFFGWVSTSAISAPTVVEHPAMRYDPQTQTYTMEFPATSEREKALPSVVWSSKTLIDPAVAVDVSSVSANELRYRYTVSNGTAARQKINLFWLVPVVAISGIDRQAGLPLGKLTNPYEPINGGTSTEIAKMQRDRSKAFLAAEESLGAQTRTSVIVDSDWWPNVTYVSRRGGSQLSLMARPNDGINRGIHHGQSMSFEFKSTALPGIISIPFEGSAPLPLLPGEDERTDEQTAAWRKYQSEDFIHVLTIAPSRAQPQPATTINLLAGMQTEVNSWPNRKIASADLAHAVEAGLRGVANNASSNRAAAELKATELRNLLAASANVPTVVSQLTDIYLSLLLRRTANE